MEINISTGLFSRRRRVEPPRRRRVEEVLSNVDLEAYNLATIKIQSSDHVIPEVPRHIHPACPSCIVCSQAVIYQHYRLLGSHNCFKLKTSNRSNPFFVRLLPEVFHYIKLPNTFTQKVILTPAEVKSAAKSMLEYREISSGSFDFEIIQKFASLFGTASSRLSNWIFNLLSKIKGWIAGKIFALMFESVCVHHGELEMIRVVLATELPVIFVPLHRSHLDSFLISWSLLTNGLPYPFFVADHSLMDTPFLGKLAKWFGGLGCSQRQRDRSIGYQSPEVNVALPAYFSLLWERGNSVIFPVEPHRSRNGKPCTTLLGREYFSILLKLYERKQIEDAFVIPVSVSYDILPEDDILQSYDVSECEPTFRHWWKRFLHNKGFARIGFSQPFRLRELKTADSSSALGHSKKNSADRGYEHELPLSDTASLAVIGADSQWYKRNGSVASLSSIYGETDYIEPVGDDLVKANELLNHSFYDAAESSVLMSTHLVAFLVLKKGREGISMGDLVSETHNLKQYIRDTHKRDVGFSGETLEVVQRAIKLLGSSLEKFKVNKEFFVKPDLNKSKLVKLNYYASHIMPLFAMRGIVAIAAFQLVDPSVILHADIQYRTHEFYIREMDLANAALEVAEILKTEFLLHPPCTTTRNAVLQTVERMKEEGFFRSTEMPSVRQYIDEDDYDYDSDGNPNVPAAVEHTYKLKLNNSSEFLDLLTFYKDLFVPQLQFYAFAVQQLRILIPSSDALTEGVEDMKLRKEIYSAAQKRVEQNLFRFEEYVTMDMIRNFLSLMTNMGVIEFYANAESQWKKMHCLKPEFGSADCLDSLSASIFRFCHW